MDPVTIVTLVVGLGSFLIGHYRLLPFLPAPSPKAPVFPNTFGHGELLAFINQSVSNYLNSVNGGGVSPAPGPVPAVPQVDLQALFVQLLAILEKQIHPSSTPVTPVTPVPFVAPK